METILISQSQGIHTFKRANQSAKSEKTLKEDKDLSK